MPWKGTVGSEGVEVVVRCSRVSGFTTMSTDPVPLIWGTLPGYLK